MEERNGLLPRMRQQTCRREPAHLYTGCKSRPDSCVHSDFLQLNMHTKSQDEKLLLEFVTTIFPVESIESR
jgi:hypothetical protein